MTIQDSSAHKIINPNRAILKTEARDVVIHKFAHNHTFYRLGLNIDGHIEYSTIKTERNDEGAVSSLLMSQMVTYKELRGIQ